MWGCCKAGEAERTEKSQKAARLSQGGLDLTQRELARASMASGRDQNAWRMPKS